MTEVFDPCLDWDKLDVWKPVVRYDERRREWFVGLFPGLTNFYCVCCGKTMSMSTMTRHLGKKRPLHDNECDAAKKDKKYCPHYDKCYLFVEEKKRMEATGKLEQDRLNRLKPTGWEAESDSVWVTDIAGLDKETKKSHAVAAYEAKQQPATEPEATEALLSLRSGVEDLETEEKLDGLDCDGKVNGHMLNATTHLDIDGLFAEQREKLNEFRLWQENFFVKICNGAASKTSEVEVLVAHSKKRKSSNSGSSDPTPGDKVIVEVGNGLSVGRDESGLGYCALLGKSAGAPASRKRSFMLTNSVLVNIGEDAKGVAAKLSLEYYVDKDMFPRFKPLNEKDTELVAGFLKRYKGDTTVLSVLNHMATQRLKKERGVEIRNGCITDSELFVDP